MKEKTILILALLTTPIVSAQQPASAGASKATSRQAPIVAREVNPARERQESLIKAEQNRSILRDINHKYLENRQEIEDLYRKTGKKDLTLLAVNSDSSAKYKAFLQQKNTGLIKLLPNADCNKDLNVVTAKEKCLKYDFPGAGSSYSFRLADYRINRLSDLIFDGESFLSNGVWSQGILVAVGDIPLEKLTVEDPAMKYLIDFQPSVEQSKAGEDQQKLIDGVKINGYTYAQSAGVMQNTTYALRSIAYQGKFYREHKGIIYDELAFDKRKDIIVGFRIIGKEPDGSILVLWKEMSRKDSPKFLPRKDKKQ